MDAALMDFVFWAHFTTSPWHIEIVTWDRTGVLVGFTFLASMMMMGTIGGWPEMDLSRDPRDSASWKFLDRDQARSRGKAVFF
jgi:hypothetical protein